MKTPLNPAELEARSEALRDTFPDMPNGRDVLLGALLDAATLDDEAPNTSLEPMPLEGDQRPVASLTR